MIRAKVESFNWKETKTNRNMNCEAKVLCGRERGFHGKKYYTKCPNSFEYIVNDNRYCEKCLFTTYHFISDKTYPQCDCGQDAHYKIVTRRLVISSVKFICWNCIKNNG